MTFRDVADTKLGTKQTQDASKHQSTLKGKQYHNDDGTRMMGTGLRSTEVRSEEHGGQAGGFILVKSRNS